MTKKFCDRCGKEINSVVYVLRNREYYRRILYFISDKDSRFEVEHEICEECQNDLYKWWAEGGSNGKASSKD